MALTPGTRLGVYEVIAPIGEGGMGQVLRARDTKLDRDVAIKILPDAFSHDADRLARFQREAKTLASLNHPNIAAIYGLEESGGMTALVMELVEGDDLSQRIARGAIPLDEALPIARQIADALESAHEQGIVHRDLKPANIKIRPDGTVKVLDFGLAKALGTDGGTSPAGLSNSPTITSPAGMTGVGVLLGTAAYMAPEQARGKPVDKRADIWAFGAVLYEMLTGTRAFAGEDLSLTLAEVIKGEPHWQALPSMLPPGIRIVLSHCLRKDPKQRLRDIGDVRLALDGAFERGPSPIAGTAAAPARPMWREVLPWAVATVAVAVAMAAFLVRSAPPTPVARFEIELPEFLRRTITIGPGNVQRELALSPDGRSLVYVEGERSTSRLMRRDIDQLTPTEIAGSEQQQPTMPFFSPDGGTVGFLSGRTRALMKIPIAGGTPVALSERFENRAPPSGATWLPDGTIVLSAAGSLWRLPATGGAPNLLLETPGGTGGPTALPGGHAVLFHVGGASGDEASLEALVLSSGERRKIVSGRDPFYVPTGHLVFARANGSLWAAPFDVDRLTITREPTPLSLTAFRLSSVASAQFSVATNGSLAYVPGESQAGSGGGGILAWVGRNGAATPVIDEPGVYDYPRLSPDESRIAFSRNDIWVRDLRRGSRTRLTFDGRTTPARGAPVPILVWASDSQRVTFNRAGDDPAKPASTRIVWTKADGSDTRELVQSDGLVTPSSWSSDGKALAYQSRIQTVNRDLWIFEPGGKPRERPFVATPAEERAPVFSPDGEWIAYVSNESGTDEIYVRPYPGPGERVTISNGGAIEPVWSRDGRELFYRVGNAMMAVSVVAGPTTSFGQPHELFQGQYLGDYSAAAAYPYYDVARDGRFLMVQRPASATTKVVFVQNWAEDLKRLVPTK